MGILNAIGIRPVDRVDPVREGTFKIAGVRVWNPGEAAAAPATLEIAGGVIDRLSASSAEPAQDEFAGCTITPGLTDMHVHLPPDNALRLTPLMSLLYLSHGVTSIRDAGDLDGTSIDAARRLQEAELGQMPTLARTESMLRQVGVPLGWHRMEASMLKVEGTEMAQDILDQAMQTFGAMGVTKELPLQLMHQQVRLMRVYEGPSEVHRSAIGRRILGSKV